MIRAVIFDLDDTLFPERSFVHSGIRAVAEWLKRTGLSVDFGKIAIDLFEGGWKGKLFDEALVRAGIDASPRLVQSMVEVYRTHQAEIELYEDANWVLAKLRPTHLLGILTDGFADAQQSKIEALGLRARMDVMVITDVLGRNCWKPSPAGFLKAMAELGVRAESCAYVGDNPSKDFVAPNHLGWLTIQVHRPQGIHADVQVAQGGVARRQIDSLLELPDQLG